MLDYAIELVSSLTLSEKISTENLGPEPMEIDYPEWMRSIELSIDDLSISNENKASTNRSPSPNQIHKQPNPNIEDLMRKPDIYVSDDDSDDMPFVDWRKICKITGNRNLFAPDKYKDVIRCSSSPKPLVKWESIKLEPVKSESIKLEPVHPVRNRQKKTSCGLHTNQLDFTRPKKKDARPITDWAMLKKATKKINFDI